MAASKYSGKSFVITGGGGGMGRETARLLLEWDAMVVLVDVSEEALNEARGDLGPTREIRTLRSDLGRPEDCARAFDLARAPLHGLVHLAGISVPDPEDASDMSVFDAVMGANTRNGY